MSLWRYVKHTQSGSFYNAIYCDGSAQVCQLLIDESSFIHVFGDWFVPQEEYRALHPNFEPFITWYCHQRSWLVMYSNGYYYGLFDPDTFVKMFTFEGFSSGKPFKDLIIKKTIQSV